MSQPTLQQLRDIRIKYYTKPKPKQQSKIKFIIRSKPKPVLDNCPICMDEMDTDLMATICNHKFHKSCWTEYESSVIGNTLKCPMCRHCIKSLAKKWGLDYYVNFNNELESDIMYGAGRQFNLSYFKHNHYYKRLNPPVYLNDGSVDEYESYTVSVLAAKPGNPDLNWRQIINHYSDVNISPKTNNHFKKHFSMAIIHTQMYPDETAQYKIYLVRKSKIILSPLTNNRANGWRLYDADYDSESEPFGSVSADCNYSLAQPAELFSPFDYINEPGAKMNRYIRPGYYIQFDSRGITVATPPPPCNW